MQKLTRYCLLVFISVMTLPINAQLLQSSKQKPLVIELFTSQGCSSCPPADEWLSQYIEHPELWQRVFPMAFHVTYWNYLGWADTFSQQAFTQRQYDHLNNLNIRQVYTPQLLVNGQEWRHWYHLGWALAGQPELPLQETAVLKIDISAHQLTAHYSAPLTDKARLYFAWVGAGYQVAVKSGENHGKQLKNPFVVLSLTEYQLADGQFLGKIPPKPKVPNSIRLARIAWLEDQGKPLQAVGEWFELTDAQK